MLTGIGCVGYSGAMDIVLALLPWKLVWPLNMRKKEKIGVIIAMSMGVFAGITAVIKVAMTPRMKEGDICEFPCQLQTETLIILGRA